MNPRSIVILRDTGVSTLGWESNPDSFFFWFVNFGHGHIDGWKTSLSEISEFVTAN